MMFTNGRFLSRGGCRYCRLEFIDGWLRTTCVDFRCKEAKQ